MIDDERISEHRLRGLDPDRPVLRGSAQNPDVFFQAREACTPFHAAVPDAVQAAMDRFAALTGRQYRLADYHGAPDADRVIVIMGSGAGAVREAVDALNAAGERVGRARASAVPPVPHRAAAGRAAAVHPHRRRARPLQGAGRPVRAAAPRRAVGDVAQRRRLRGPAESVPASSAVATA